jgi:uncharacterized protein YbcC (UPF0753/DUF2309 family)
VNRETIKWLTAFLDEGQATIRMPGRERGFYKAFSGLAPFDRALRQRDAPWLASLPETPEKTIFECLKRLKVSPQEQEEFMRQHMAALPGWAGYVKWRDQWQNPDEGNHHPITLVDYIAVRLVITAALWQEAKVLKQEVVQPPLFLERLPEKERVYRQRLLAALLPEAPAIEKARHTRPDAHLVFCIDVRSEPFRRSIEATGNYQTLGFAGFFGLPIRVKGYDDAEAHDSCPVLLKPCHEVGEYAAEPDHHAVKRHDYGRAMLQLPKSLYQALKYHFATPFALVEILGPWLGIRMLARTFAPVFTENIKRLVVGAVIPPISTEPSLEEISIEQQANYGEGALRMMGLIENLAKIVVFCGHGSSTNNNAYAAALDCGACGGHHGGSNARILATILNKEDVRTILAARGLLIPVDTLFLAAEHDTTTDQVTIFEARGYAAKNREAIEKLRADLQKARTANALVRCQTFEMEHENAPLQAALKRSMDWAQPRPEWGLARNAAFIVGPRELTRQVNLEGRCFLHSYNWKQDEGGTFLQTILTAPMVVAHWINSQYLFSTLDNVSYGGGSKVTKNVTGKIGIMQGNASDLMHGLPLQSVFATDDRPYHEPLRLLAVVYAPRLMLETIIQRQDTLKKLFGNGWVSLVCIEPLESKPYLLQRDLTWQVAD